MDEHNSFHLLYSDDDHESKLVTRNRPMKTASDKLTSVIWEGFAINNIAVFHSGPLLHGQYFFELKFAPPITGSPFKPGIDDPEDFKEKPITLNFQDASGKVKPVIANIIKVAYTKNTGQQTEIIIGGTMYQPSGTVSKFSLIAVALVILPVLLLSTLCLYVNSVQSDLIPMQGKVVYFKDSSYKRFKKYTFKLSPHQATLYRKYDRPLFDKPIQHIDALFMSEYDGFHKDSIGQPVRFYLLPGDRDKLNDAGERLTFFDLQSLDRSPAPTDHFWDMWNYVTDKTWIYFAWLTFLAAEVACYCSAYYFYKMYALYHQPRSKVLWWGTVGLSSLLNFMIVMTIA